jgi:phosphohistidine phosphatase SixA
VAIATGAWLLAWPGCSRSDDATLLRELRGGAAVLMRHTQTTPGVGDPPGWRLEQCQSQRNLAPSGIEHAKRIGRWFTTNELRVSRVRNSPWCRTRDTATLAFDRHDDWVALSNIFEDRSGADAALQVNQYIRTLKPGELVVLVSHGSTIGHIVPGHGGLAPGESVVVRAAASGADAPLLTLGRLVVP